MKKNVIIQSVKGSKVKKGSKEENGFLFSLDIDSKKAGDYSYFTHNEKVGEVVKDGVKEGNNKLSFTLTDEDMKSVPETEGLVFTITTDIVKDVPECYIFVNSHYLRNIK